MSNTVDDETAIAAKAALQAAITAYFKIVEPEVYVDEWVLISHKMSTEWEQENQSVVGYLVPTGQAFHHTRGLLDVALTADRNLV